MNGTRLKQKAEMEIFASFLYFIYLERMLTLSKL